MATAPLPWVKYAQQQAPPPGDNTPPWEKYAGAATATPPAPAPAPESGVSGFLRNMLPQHPIQAAQQSAEEFKQHPIRSSIENLVGGPALPALEGAYEGAKRSGGELLQAGKSLLGGNPAQAAVHGVNAVPIIGPAMVNAAEKPDVGGTGSYLGDLKSTIESPSAMGTLTGAAASAAPIMAGGADFAAPERLRLGEIPTRAKAGKIFESLKTDLANQPVRLTRSGPALQRLAEIDATGPSMPPTASKLLTRSQAIFPPNYPEARLFQENLSNPSILEKQSIGGSMKGGIKQLKKEFYADIQDAADQGGGRGADYAKAMKMNRLAARNATIGKNLLKYGGTGAAGYLGANELHRFLGTMSK